METDSVKAPMSVQVNEENKSGDVPLPPIYSNGSDENAIESIAPQTILITSTSSSMATANNEKTNNSEPPTSKSTPIFMELERISAQLAVAQQMIVEKEAENWKQKENLCEAANLLFEQRMDLEEKFHFDFGQQANDHSWWKEGSALSRLQVLVTNERKQRLEAEEKLEKLEDSLKKMNEPKIHAIHKFEKLFTERQNQLKINFEESLEELAKTVLGHVKKHEEEQVEQIRKLANNLVFVHNI